MKMTTDFRQAAMRRGFVPVSRTVDGTPANLAVAASLEMANLGFRVSPDALEGMSATALTNMIADARVVIGADRAMKPIYPGFPKQVQELDTLTLWFEQILHYWTAGEFLPNYPEVERAGLPLEDMARADRVLVVSPAADVARSLVTSLTRSMVALSVSEKELLAGAVDMSAPSLDEVTTVLSGARHGENAQSLLLAARSRSLAKVSADDIVISLAPTAKNPDQLLRIVLAATASISGDEQNPRHRAGFDRAVNHLSDKDHRAVRLATLSRPARRALLSRLGQLTEGFYADALVGRINLWRRVMKMAHPYSVKVSDEHKAATKRALDIVHGNVEYRTLNFLVEDAVARKDVGDAVSLMASHQPGNLLRRAVALLRISTTDHEVEILADALRAHGPRSAVSTLVSAYNGILSVNDQTAKLTRVAGRNNAVVESKDHAVVPDAFVDAVLSAVKDALTDVLGTKAAPIGVVGVSSSAPVPLVRRDAATTDRVMDRGERLAPSGDGDTARIFGHWRNNQHESGYMDCGAVVLDGDFNVLNVITWDTWAGGRDWATYSGDKLVHVGDSAAEYIDVDLPKLRAALPDARWVAMTIQSYSGFPTKDVDMIAGVMLRSAPDSGEVFDARSVVTAFKPTTESTQSVPLALDLSTGEIIWTDSSNGSTRAGLSAGGDDTVGTVVYNEVARPRMTTGELAELWARAHGAETADEPVDRDQVLALLG